MSKNGKSGAELAALRAEIGLLRKLDHPCIILMLDYFETPKEVVLVTEYAHGELWQILTDDKSLPEEVVASVARQLVDALHYLHSHRIVHRDMKPQNVLVSSGGVVKLADFGFARQMSASTVMLTSIKGTPLYLAPEIFCDHAYEYKADLWGLGVMLYVLPCSAPRERPTPACLRPGREPRAHVRVRTTVCVCACPFVLCAHAFAVCAGMSLLRVSRRFTQIIYMRSCAPSWRRTCASRPPSPQTSSPSCRVC